jgi:hypothetical protein
LDNCIRVVNLALNCKRNKDWKEALSKILVPINTTFLSCTLNGAVLLSYSELRLPPWLIAKPKSSHTGSELPRITQLWLDCVINLLKLKLRGLFLGCSFGLPYKAG